MTKPYRTGIEKRNDERLKSIIRDELICVMTTQTELLEAFIVIRERGDNAFVAGKIADLQRTIGTLRWLIEMYKPADPATVNQYNMVADGETPA